MTVSAAFLDQLAAIVGADNVITRVARCAAAPGFLLVLAGAQARTRRQAGDVIVQPHSVDELRAVIALAVSAGMPITPGAGTGNYGQSIPLQGGIVVNLRGLDGILDITSDFARWRPACCSTAWKRRPGRSAEMRFYPSTLPGHGRRLPGGRLGRRRFGHLGHALG
ncbi:MAG: FAD-binding protein [Caldilineaceae bacterium]